MPLTFRGIKGSALTYEELDENFAWLANNSANTLMFLANTSGTVFDGNLIVSGSITANNLTGGNYLANVSGTVFDGDLKVTGNVIIGAELFYLSDRDLKYNIQDLVEPSMFINQIRPVTFNWKTNDRQSYGFIAQELEEVLPNLVMTDSNEVKSISTTQLIAVLFAAVKEQQNQIIELSHQINLIANS